MIMLSTAVITTSRRNQKMFRWNVVGVAFAGGLALLLVVLLDTDTLVQWIADHKDSKIDEIIFTGILLLAGFALFSIRKALAVSRQLERYEDATKTTHIPEVDRMKACQRHDLFGLGLVLLASFLLVMFFDTGWLADWIARHKDTKIDEVIITGVILLVGLLFLSVRRWLELSSQVVKYEELHKRTSKLNREIVLLGELSELLQSCLSFEEAYNLITDRAQLLFPGSAGAVCITASSRDAVEVVATWGNLPGMQTHFEPKDCWALRRGRLHKLEGDTVSLACAHLGSSKPAGAMCVPMMAHGEALGLLYLDTRSGANADEQPVPGEFSSSEERLARTLAEQSAIALANLNMRDVLKMQSVRDPLTGLFNRRYMEESLTRELGRARRKGAPLTVLMLDVDHFKKLNDTFGHEAGDVVLRSLGSVLRTHFRVEDIVCRYGGEEFAVILPDASTEAAYERAVQLCEAVKGIMVQYRGTPIHSVSVSIGVAGLGQHGSTPEALLRAADAALYLAKKQGRDRVLLASPRDSGIRKEESDWLEAHVQYSGAGSPVVPLV